MEFKQSICVAESEVEQWARTLPFPLLVSKAITPVIDKSDDDPLSAICQLNNNDVEMICNGLLNGLKEMMSEQIENLRASLQTMTDKAAQGGGNAASKFQVVKMSSGKVSDYYAGIEGRTGLPHLDFFKGMEMEHCLKAGFSVPFTTSNYKITTTPSREWKYTVEGEKCPDMDHGRGMPNIHALLETSVVKEGKLSKAEVIAVVLYSGPMFHVYNAILRRWPEKDYKRYEEGGNLFSTTIYVLVSAVQKLSRSVALPDGLVLYRGLGGAMELPDSFFQGDERGCRGFAEWGFMSTTSDKAVALSYSGVMQGRPCATVLEIRVGAVDRGASIRELSQYPGEVEYLWLPCSWLEPQGPSRYEATPDGAVRMVPCHARANLKTMTTEELVGRKKAAHLAAFRFLLDDVGADLAGLARRPDAQERLLADTTREYGGGGSAGGAAAPPRMFTVAGLVDRILEQCREVVAEHEGVAAAEYADEVRFRGLTLGMLDTVRMAGSKLRHWLDDRSSCIAFLHAAPLREVHRDRIAFLRRTLADGGGGGGGEDPEEARRRGAEALCSIRGLIGAGVGSANELGESWLMAAAADGRAPDDLRLLAAAGIAVDRADRHGCTALHAACAAGHADVARTLLELRASVDARDARWGRTPLFVAASYGHPGCLGVLLAAGAAVDGPNRRGDTTVWVAAAYGHAGCVAALAAARADVSAASPRGTTPVLMAAAKGYADCVRALADARADLDTPSADDRGVVACPRGATPLWAAAHHGHAECARALLERGADAEAVCQGRRAVEEAAARGHSACAEALERRHARA